jgi:hypothetical protein
MVSDYANWLNGAVVDFDGGEYVNLVRKLLTGLDMF